MINKYFEDEEIQQNDLFFMCSTIERVARKIHQRNKYVVNDWINEYHLKKGTFNIKDVDKELCTIIPTPLDMGKVYMRLIVDTALANEDYVSGIIRVYNDGICKIIDNYTNGAFYEPSYVIARAYKEGEF